jgi:hypothetical protein
LTEGFAWNGKTYRSLTKVAFAITGTRWNGPKFFGLRDAALLMKTMEQYDRFAHENHGAV